MITQNIRVNMSSKVFSRGAPSTLKISGRVFTEEELRRLGEFCERHDLTIVSDEIHCDLILNEGLKHLSMLTVDNGVSFGNQAQNTELRPLGVAAYLRAKSRAR